MNIDIKPYTIIMTVGPSNCGKSYFCENILIPQLQQLQPLCNRSIVSINYISSDNIRRSLLNDNLDKYHPAMMTASKSAFDILYTNIEAACRFPSNSEFIIVDTKGTNEAFRSKLIDIATKYQYNLIALVFFYSEYNEYKQYGPLLKFIINDIKKTQEYFLSKNTNSIISKIRIKTNNFSDINIISTQHELLTKCVISNETKYFCISDIHGCYDEFIQLLNNNQFIIENNRIINDTPQLILLGDFIDNGPKKIEMIDFIWNNLDKIKIISANHEYRLFKTITGELIHANEPWYDTYNILSADMKKKFLQIINHTVPFVRNDYFIATHAPCKMKYLGKLDTKSLKRQRYCYYEEKPYYEFLADSGIFADELCNLYHIFGHMPTTDVGCIDKRILIDSGCVFGNKLSGVLIDKSHYKIYSVDSQQQSHEYNKLQKYSKPRVLPELNIADLPINIQKRIQDCIKNKVNFISGTMSPVDKMDDKLESIEAGIAFFKSHNVFDITMQQKYMGSRANCYLFSDNQHSYMISRNGYKIKLPLDHIYDQLRTKLTWIDWQQITCIILDGELMPWSALGGGLIQDFRTVGSNLNHELQFLQDTNFEAQFNSLQNEYKLTSFEADMHKLSTKELIKKYGDLKYSTYKTIHDYIFIPLYKQKELANIYNQQIELYGQPTKNNEIYYKPFAILKIVYKSGSEIIPYIHGLKHPLNNTEDLTNESMFNLINDDKCYTFNLCDENDIHRLISIFKSYTVDKHYEGVVLKPASILETHTPPYIKVRNPQYLSIIYGYDYQIAKKKLLLKKSIKKKLHMSINEWQLGLKLLSIPYVDLSTNNNAKQLLAQCFLDIEKEEALDPRL